VEDLLTKSNGIKEMKYEHRYEEFQAAEAY
jgi:hypothetical protein